MQAGGLKDRGKRPWLARLGEEEEQGWHSGDGEFCEGLGRSTVPRGQKGSCSSNAVTESIPKPFLT